MTTYIRELLAIERENQSEEFEQLEDEMDEIEFENERLRIVAELEDERDWINQIEAERAADNWFDLTHNAFN